MLIALECSISSIEIVTIKFPLYSIKLKNTKDLTFVDRKEAISISIISNYSLHCNKISWIFLILITIDFIITNIRLEKKKREIKMRNDISLY